MAQVYSIVIFSSSTLFFYTFSKVLEQKIRKDISFIKLKKMQLFNYREVSIIDAWPYKVCLMRFVFFRFSLVIVLTIVKLIHNFFKSK